jgi:hypothetical protein
MGRNPLAAVFTSLATNFIPFDTNGSIDIFVLDRRLTPEVARTEKGTPRGHDLGLFRFSDDARSSVFPSGSMLSVVFERSSPLGSIDTLEFEVESSASATGVTRTIELYDFDAESYEMFNEAPATQEDESVVVRISSNATRFVGPNGQLRARVAFELPGPTLVRWQAYFDHVRWTVNEL